MTRFLLYVCTFLFLGGAPAIAQDKKDDAKKDPPRVVLISPLGVTAGTTAVLKIRGFGLAEATEVKLPGATPPIVATIKSKGKADAAQGVEPADAGDTQVEVELTAPKEAAASILTVVVVTPAATTEPHALLVTDPAETTEEQEPNGGFRQPQALALPTTVRGKIENAEDVDVFSISAKSGQTVVAEVAAARHGSALDSLLTLYDARGNVLVTNDDAGPELSDDGAGHDDNPRPDPVKALAARAKRDSTLTFRCLADGTYFLSLLDAHGRGGAAHVYQLSVKATN